MIDIELMMLIVILLDSILGITTFVLGMYSSFYGYRLIYYLRKNKRRRWKELLRKGWFKYLGVIYFDPREWIRYPLRMIRYTYNDLDTDDKTIQKYKEKIRLPLKLALFSGCLSIILFFIIIGLAYFGGLIIW